MVSDRVGPTGFLIGRLSAERRPIERIGTAFSADSQGDHLIALDPEDGSVLQVTNQEQVAPRSAAIFAVLHLEAEVGPVVGSGPEERSATGRESEAGIKDSQDILAGSRIESADVDVNLHGVSVHGYVVEQAGYGQYVILKRALAIGDAFGQPILYYVASANGRPTNMVEDKRDEKNNYGCASQSHGPPYYFHQDNEMFTGNKNERGWDFDGPHKIARAGGDFTADQLVDVSNVEAQESFARFIVDRTLYRNLLNRATEENEPPSCNAPLRPVNADSYLLISAGVDGRYGTNDDVTNFPLAVE